MCRDVRLSFASDRLAARRRDRSRRRDSRPVGSRDRLAQRQVPRHRRAGQPRTRGNRHHRHGGDSRQRHHPGKAEIASETTRSAVPRSAQNAEQPFPCPISTRPSSCSRRPERRVVARARRWVNHRRCTLPGVVVWVSPVSPLTAPAGSGSAHGLCGARPPQPVLSHARKDLESAGVKAAHERFSARTTSSHGISRSPRSRRSVITRPTRNSAVVYALSGR